MIYIRASYIRLFSTFSIKKMYTYIHFGPYDPTSISLKILNEGLRGVNKCLPCSSWMRLRMLIDPNGKVPVKVVARTFASGKTEKLVYQCLADLGLSSGKVRGERNENKKKERKRKTRIRAIVRLPCRNF